MHYTRDPFTGSSRAKKPAAAQMPTPITKSKFAERKRRILLIDDGLVQRDPVRDMLGTCGYTVYVSRNDDGAIEDYLMAKKAGYPFDFIVLDLHVPYSIGGKDTIRKLIAEDPDAKALVIASHCIDPIMKRFEEYGFQDALAKPFTLDQLQEAITSSLAGADRRQREKEPEIILHLQNVLKR